MRRALIAVLLAGLLGPGCGKDTVGPEPGEVTGAWTATKVEYVSKADGTTVDTVPLGGNCTLVLNPDKSSTLTTKLPGEDPLAMQGTWGISEDQLEFYPSGGGEFAWNVVLSGGTMKLTGADWSYDFNDDGQADPATFNLDLRK
jgi:hypothetical protein